MTMRWKQLAQWIVALTMLLAIQKTISVWIGLNHDSVGTMFDDAFYQAIGIWIGWYLAVATAKAPDRGRVDTGGGG